MAVVSNTPVQSAAFAEQGYVVVRQFVEPAVRDAVLRLVQADLAPVVGPAEFEADVGYPGAPGDRSAAGGDTPRRLLHAYARNQAYRTLATGAAVARHLQQLHPSSGNDPWCLSQCHHNCVMTKYPGYSSATLWHQDVRYWSFDRPELISCWLALGEENQQNGALAVIPGSHVLDIERGRLDRDLFLRPELAENKALIDSARTVELQPGDALFFHCRLFHAAGRNRTDVPKLSCVFTYHQRSNQPIPDTRSAAYPSIELPVAER